MSLEYEPTSESPSASTPQREAGPPEPLSTTQVTSNEIGVALEAAEKTEATINDTRQRYTPYPERG